MNALEDYCDYVAAYYDANATLDANDALNEVDTATAFNSLEVSDLTDTTVQAVGMSLLTEEDTTIRLYIQATAAPTTVSITTTNADGESVTITEAAEVKAVDGLEGYYYVELENVSGFDLATEYTFTVDGVTVTCSALSYGALVVENMSNNTELVNVVKALYNYSEAATAYKAAQQ